MPSSSRVSVPVLLLCTIIASVAIAVSAWTISRFMLRVEKNTEKTVTVKGVAEKEIQSDIGALSCSFAVKAQQIADGYAELNRVNALFQKKLAELGFEPGEESDVSISYERVTKTVKTQENGKEVAREEFSHYEFQRSCRILSGKVQQLAEASVKLYELTAQGIVISVGTPQFFISDPEKYKLELVDAASVSAYQRGESVAASCHAKIGKLLTARQGVIQITRPADNQSSDYGVYDTSSIPKIMRMVVTVTFALK
ncbi:MAG: SIMPL domain-containing protein [Victivallaceae bacterium]|nr:SIMPL domain-containing protein [Victivallaceae bacterium]